MFEAVFNCYGEPSTQLYVGGSWRPAYNKSLLVKNLSDSLFVLVKQRLRWHEIVLEPMKIINNPDVPKSPPPSMNWKFLMVSRSRCCLM